MPLPQFEDSPFPDNQNDQIEKIEKEAPPAPTIPRPPRLPKSPEPMDEKKGNGNGHAAGAAGAASEAIVEVEAIALPVLPTLPPQLSSKSFVLPPVSDAPPAPLAPSAPPSLDALPDLPSDFGYTYDIVLEGELERGKGKKRIDLKDLLVFFENSDKIVPSLANIVTILTYERSWWNTLAWDSFNHAIIVEKMTPWGKGKGERWNDADDSELTAWLQSQKPGKLNVSSSLVSEAVGVVARRRVIHPVQAYLKSLKWDRVERLESWLTRYMGAEDRPITRAFASRWLISAIARVMSPGCQADHTLLLEGAQGTRKSTALRTLASDPWFTDHISDLHDKDSRMELQGKWIVELSELHAIKGKGMEAVKSFLTTRIDSYRAPYAHYIQSVPRQCVFAATTNDDQALTDETGNRRFWPVQCGEIDILNLERDRDQLWAEAFALWKLKRAWWLDSPSLVAEAEEEQALHLASGPYDEQLQQWLADPHPSASLSSLSSLTGADPPPFESVPGKVTMSDILTHALSFVDGERKGRPDIAVARYLKATGWKSIQERGRDQRGKRFWIKAQS